MIGGFVLAVVTSFDEAVFINFIGGPGLTTLPKAILDSARLGVDPVIMAVATLLMVATSILMILALKFARSTDE
jgi:ABC-type spermidine/putrescine transport system permease subunit II